MEDQGLKPRRYLLIDLEAALEEVTNPKANDLIIRNNIQTEKYTVLKNGNEIVKNLHSLIDDYGFILASSSQKPEKVQLTWFTTFEKICKENNIQPLPSVAAMPVNDWSCFQNVKPQEPIIIKNRDHKIWIAGYDQREEGIRNICVREALSELLDIKESERKFNVILDHSQAVVTQAREEGWLANIIGVPSIEEVIKRIKKSSEDPFGKKRDGIKGENTPENFSNFPAISKKKFKQLDKAVERGSAPSRHWYLDEASNTTWFGKCSFKGVGGWVIEHFVQYVVEPDSFDEYREYLASRLYSLLGVRTPELLLSHQPLDLFCRGTTLISLTDLHGPRIHLMSQFIDGFKELGEKFTWNYRQSACNSPARYYQIEGGKIPVPLRGFGAALATSVFVHDYDCIGNSGANMGYVVAPDGFAEIIKIDPGEALSFAEDMSGAQNLNNDPEKREVLVGTMGKIIRYTDLNYEDKKEFAETIRRILEIPNRLIEELFSPFLEMDKRFETILTTLLKRKKEILEAFSEEVRVLILNQMKDADEERAKQIIANWEKPIQFPKETESTTELIKNRAYLEATVLSSQPSSSTKMFQVPTLMKDFIGRKEELESLNQHLSLSGNRINYVAIVGLSGLGKTQLTTEYVRSHKDSYSHIVWLNAANSSIIYNQILVYLQVYSKVQLSLQNSHENCVKMFYQSFGGDRMGQNKKKKICVVLDNAHKLEGMVQYILSPSGKINYNFDIIITSSYQKWEAPVDKIINLQKFTSEEVREYLQSKIPNCEVSNERISQFAELLDGLPLAIAQAVAYLQHNNLTVSQYISHLEEFQKTHNFHLSLLSLIDEKRIQNTQLEDNKEVPEHFLNEDLLLVQQKKLSKLGFSSLVFSLANLRCMNENADSILGVLAYLSTDYITKSIVQGCWLEYMKQIQGVLPVNSKLPHQQLFEEGLELLTAHSFVKGEGFKNKNIDNKKSKLELNFASSQAKKSTDTIIRINSLTQAIVRLIHQKNELFDVYYKSVFDYVLQQLEYDQSRLNEIQRVSWVIPHGTTLINLSSKIGELKSLEMLNKIACYQLYESGEYKEAFNTFMPRLYPATY